MKDSLTSKQRLDERTGAPELWVYRDGYHFAQVTFTKPDPKLYPTAVRYVLADETDEDTSHERAGVYRNGDPL